MQPDAIADHRRELPSLREALADDHVIDPDHLPLNVGNVATQEIDRFDHAAEAFRQGAVQGDFSEVMQQTTNKCVRRLDAQLLGERFGTARDRQAMLPEVIAIEMGVGEGLLALKRMKNTDREHRAAYGIEPE